MSLPSVVVLIGLRGAGKTTLGRALAAELNRPFADLDDLALASCAESNIQEVFQNRGEQAWRDAEARALDAALAGSGQVLALGGGAPMVDAIATAISAARENGSAHVLWLDAPDSVLAERIGEHGDARPPLLHDVEGVPLSALEECHALREARGERYGQLAQDTVDTSGSVPEVVQRILRDTALR